MSPSFCVCLLDFLYLCLSVILWLLVSPYLCLSVSLSPYTSVFLSLWICGSVTRCLQRENKYNQKQTTAKCSQLKQAVTYLLSTVLRYQNSPLSSLPTGLYRRGGRRRRARQNFEYFTSDGRIDCGLKCMGTRKESSASAPRMSMPSRFPLILWFGSFKNHDTRWYGSERQIEFWYLLNLVDCISVVVVELILPVSGCIPDWLIGVGAEAQTEGIIVDSAVSKSSF